MCTVSGEIARSYGLKVAEGRAGIKDTRGVEIDHGDGRVRRQSVARLGQRAALRLARLDPEAPPRGWDLVGAHDKGKRPGRHPCPSSC